MLLNYLLAVLSGLLLVVVHPRWDLPILAPFAIAPLIYALLREWEPKHRFGLGYVTGLVFWAGINYWIHFVISVHGHLGSGLGTLGFLLFVVLRAIPLGVFGLLAGVLVQRRYAVFAVPCLWVAIERIPWLFSYTWLQLGNGGIDMAIPMRLAPFTGVYGLSWLFAALGTAIAVVALRRDRRQLLWLTPLAVLFVLPPLPEIQRPTESAVAVQPAIPERDDWTQELAVSTQRQMELLSMQAAFDAKSPHAPLILWPEAPAPFYYDDDAPFRERANNLARTTGAYVLIGGVAYNRQKAPVNAAFFVRPDGSAAGRYDKMFLVPFGEYIPFPFDGLVSAIVSDIGDFVPGERVVVFDAGDIRVGAFICYESAFPHLVRDFVSEGATVMANISNDGYFGGGAAREQHLSLVRMRAAENARWVLRATNDGISASVDPAGRVITTLPEWKTTSGRLPFSPRTDLTPYTRFGDIFAWTCAALALVFLVLSQIPTYRPV